MKKILAALTVAVLGLGLVVAAGPAAWAKPSPGPNHEDYWETLPGEICVKDEAPATPYVITTAAGTGLVYSKLILKAASGNDENFVINSPALNVPYSHPNTHANSHIILCTIPVNQPVTISVGPSATAPTCDVAGSLVVPVVANVTWSGGVHGAGPGVYTLVAQANSGYTLSGTSSFPVTVLGQLTGEACGIPVTITVAPSATDPTCDVAGSLVVPVVANVSWTGGSNGDGPGSYTLVAEAADGYVISGTSSFPLVVVLDKLEGEQCDNDIPVTISVAPSATDPTCDVAGSLVVPVVANVSWTGGSNGDGPGSYTLVAEAADGYVISGTSSFPLVVVLDKLEGEACYKLADVVGDPEPTEAKCAVEGVSDFTNGFYTIQEAEGVGYFVYVKNTLVDTITSTDPYGPVIFTVTKYNESTVKIEAFALPGYVLNDKQTTSWSHTFLVYEKLCNLPTGAPVTPVVDQDPPTCTQSGRFFLGGDGLGDGGVKWLTSPGGVPVAAGWHNVPSATTLTFQAVPGPDNGFTEDTQTVFEFEFLAGPLECLDLETLALTGNEGVPLFLGGAAALLLLGAASIFFARKRTL